MSRVIISSDCMAGSQSPNFPGLFDTIVEAKQAIPHEQEGHYLLFKTPLRESAGERYWHDRAKAKDQSNKVLRARLKQAIAECLIFEGTPEIDKIRAILEDA